MAGDGDSGGPLLLGEAERWRLAGLASWKVVQGGVRTTRPGQAFELQCAGEPVCGVGRAGDGGCGAAMIGASGR